MAPTRLRQIALVARDLGKAKHLLWTTVIGTEVVFEDPAVEQWGLKNFLVPLGGDFIEVVSPFKSDTAASRHLSKRGDGGYMIIMQAPDASARRRYIESNSLSKVIFAHDLEDSVCIQYHPKGIKGGMMPELDSHHRSADHPDPLHERFSPWHAAGPPSAYPEYKIGMKRHSRLRLLSATLRLAPGDEDTSAAAQQWHRLFCLDRAGCENEVRFTNARMVFVPGENGKKEGLVEIAIGVEGKESINGIMERALKAGLEVEGKSVNMLGIKWSFTSTDSESELKSLL